MARRNQNSELVIQIELIKGGYVLTYPIPTIPTNWAQFGLTIENENFVEYQLVKEIVTTQRKLNQRLKDILNVLEPPETTATPVPEQIAELVLSRSAD